MGRGETNQSTVKQLIEALARVARTPGAVYFTGGATAVLYGWRDTTVDIDLCFDPEAEGIFEALPELKNRLNINIELAAPSDFIPELPGWKAAARLIEQRGSLAFYHYDLRAQALSKIERGHQRDLNDVTEMLIRKLITADELMTSFSAIQPKLIRYPSIEPEIFEEKLTSFLADYAQRHTPSI